MCGSCTLVQTVESILWVLRTLVLILESSEWVFSTLLKPRGIASEKVRIIFGGLLGSCIGAIGICSTLHGLLCRMEGLLPQSSCEFLHL
jgi:hypothetical protein